MDSLAAYQALTADWRGLIAEGVVKALGGRQLLEAHGRRARSNERLVAVIAANVWRAVASA